jgi:hypothetical protein
MARQQRLPVPRERAGAADQPEDPYNDRMDI